MKLSVSRNEPKSKPLNRFATVAVLAAGLSFMPACKPSTPASAPPTTEQSRHAESRRDGPQSGQASSTVYYGRPEYDTLEGVRVLKAGRHYVREGDDILRMEFLFEKGAQFKLGIAKIDSTGIEVGMRMDIHLTEHADNSRAPLRIAYGDSAPLGDTGATLKAVGRSIDGAAIVELSRP